MRAKAESCLAWSPDQGVHPNLSMASKPSVGQGASVCVSLAYVARCRCMHARQSREQKGTILPILENANATIDLNGKTTSCNGMQPTRLKRLTSHLVPHLGGVAASIGALSHAGVYTLARACASAL